MARLVGGDLAVDLVNTVDPDVPGGDHIRDDDALRDWLGQVGLEGTARVSDARRVRTALDAVLRPLATGGAPAAGDLDAVRRLEARAIGRAELRPDGWRFAGPLDAIVHSAVQLVLSDRVRRLKHCGNCDWLYLDHSRNGSRRWCSMEFCGTQVKIARLTERRRAAR